MEVTVDISETLVKSSIQAYVSEMIRQGTMSHYAKQDIKKYLDTVVQEAVRSIIQEELVNLPQLREFIKDEIYKKVSTAVKKEMGL